MTRCSNNWLSFGGAILAIFVGGMLAPCKLANASALDDARAAFAKHDFTNAVAKFQEAADQGDPEAMAFMGTMYFYGIGVPYDREKAFVLNLKAAAEGRVDAQYLLGFGYNAKAVRNPDKPLRDEEYALQIKWQKAAAAGAAPKAEAGDPIAQWVLSGLIGDQSKSFFWLTKAAELNVVTAQFDLGHVYESGKGNVKPDPLKAREWYTKAAEAGHAGAAFYLAKILEASGDKEEAKLLYAKAALAGDTIASAMLRDHYNINLGDPKEFDRLQADLLAKESVLLVDRLINVGGVRLGNAIKDLNPGGEAPSPNSEYEHVRQSIELEHRLLCDSPSAETRRSVGCF